jgi:hypothetical protein
VNRNASKIFLTRWHAFVRFETDTEIRNKGQAMEIGGTTFGTITIDGKTYDHDVIIRLSGEVVKRKKKLSKKYYGTSHVLSKDEAKFVFERDASSSFSARARWAMYIYPGKLRLILRKRAAR